METVQNRDLVFVSVSFLSPVKSDNISKHLYNSLDTWLGQTLILLEKVLFKK